MVVDLNSFICKRPFFAKKNTSANLSRSPCLSFAGVSFAKSFAKSFAPPNNTYISTQYIVLSTLLMYVDLLIPGSNLNC